MNEFLHQPFANCTTEWQLGGLVVVVLIGLGFRGLRWLTTSGSLAACALGTWVVYHQGIIWLGPLAFFLASGSLLNRLTKAPASNTKDGKPRDAMQVLCNGLVYGLSASPWLVERDSLQQLGMAVSMSVATSDTWASSIGAARKGATWDILCWERVPPGLSGGVSMAGTVAGVVGALAAICVTYLCDRGLDGWNAPMFLRLLVISAFGVMGMFIDSVLGSLLQARYLNAEGQVSDDGPTLVHGFRWMTNDVVNLLSIAIATAGVIAWRSWEIT